MTDSDLWCVEGIRWHEPDARFYRVWKQGEDDDDDTAIIRRHGDLSCLVTCERCGRTEDVSFRCQHIEAFKRSPYLHFEDE